MKWEVIDVDASEICAEYHVSDLVGKVIAASHLDSEQIDQLLNPSAALNPSHAECVRKACARILQAKQNGEKVFIGGDYDADGICATAIMKDTLDRLGIPNGYYLPDRFKEGYGLKPETVEKAFAKGYRLIVTVDNGVRAAEAIAKARELGMDMVITDHHQIEEEIGVDIVVHPDYMEERFAYLCGAGVALQIAIALIGEKMEHVGLAAIASIGDVMSLWRETRTIVQLGLKYLNRGAVPAITSMVYRGSTIDPHTVSFQIVPKLNSVGRMNDISNVNTLVPFLLSRNTDAIGRYVTQLNTVNDRRRSLSNEMVKSAEKMVSDHDFQIIYDPGFHEGICGIVAGKIADSCHKPTIVMAGSDGMLRGSGRSVPGFNLFAFLNEGFEELSAFGGHEQAVGLTLSETDFEQFCRKVHDKMAVTPFVYEEKVEKAIRITEHDLSFDAVAELETLEPIARDMMEPVFALEHPEVISLKEGAKVNKYRLLDELNGLDGVLFPFRGMKPLSSMDLVCGRLSINRWRDRVNLQMDIEYMQ